MHISQTPLIMSKLHQYEKKSYTSPLPFMKIPFYVTTGSHLETAIILSYNFFFISISAQNSYPCIAFFFCLHQAIRDEELIINN